MRKKARLLYPIKVSHPTLGTVRLDGRTTLIFLFKNKYDKEGEYVFCVKKMHGTGRSGLCLKEDQFKWI